MEQDRNLKVNAANSTNTYLFTVLASSDTPHLLAVRLGLPAECGDHAGLSWYSADFDSKNQPCPEIKNASRLRLIALPFIDTGAFINMIAKSDAHMRPIFPEALGEVEGRDYGHSSVYFGSIYRWIDVLPFRSLVMLTLFICCASIFYSLWKLFQDGYVGQTHTAVYSVILFLSCTVLTIYFVSIFGDGFIDLAKHSHIGFSALTGLCILVISFFVTRFYSWGCGKYTASMCKRRSSL
jgi:hypothetical protein